MGEIAEAMLDGTFCVQCGEYLDNGGGLGYPMTCAGCGGDDDYYDVTSTRRRPRRGEKNARCKTCGKRCRGRIGLKQHMRDRHGITE